MGMSYQEVRSISKCVFFVSYFKKSSYFEKKTSTFSVCCDDCLGENDS